MSEFVIYMPGDGADIEVRLEGESVWLTQEQMAQVFERERSVITKHLRNVFKDGELEEESNVQNLHIAGSDKPVKLYNLDAIISVGYRVNSRRGVQFRKWATRTLGEHLNNGYTLDRQRFEQNANELEAALALIRKATQAPGPSRDASHGLADIVTRYAQTFLWLQRYDDGLLTEPATQAGGLRKKTP